MPSRGVLPPQRYGTPMYRSPVRSTFLAVAEGGASRPDGSPTVRSRGRDVGLRAGMSTGRLTGRSTRSPIRGINTERVRPFCAAAAEGNSNRQIPAPCRGVRRMLLVQRKGVFLRERRRGGRKGAG